MISKAALERPDCSALRVSKQYYWAASNTDESQQANDFGLNTSHVYFVVLVQTQSQVAEDSPCSAFEDLASNSTTTRTGIVV